MVYINKKSINIKTFKNVRTHLRVCLAVSIVSHNMGRGPSSVAQPKSLIYLKVDKRLRLCNTRTGLVLIRFPCCVIQC